MWSRGGTAMGLPGGGMPPPTGRQGTAMNPPGTRMGTRQGTRQGTALNAPVVGVGAHTAVEVTDRPATMHGLTGLKTGSLGPKRQVHDKSYFVVELRKRCTDLQEEVDSLRGEVEDVRQDNQLYASLEKRYDALAKTVRSLEGELADYNLATDKQRTDTRPEEVHHMFMMMKQQNDQLRAEVDQTFLEKKSHEEEIQTLHEEILTLARAAEERLSELHPDQQREYEMLQAENQQLNVELAERREDYEQISERLGALEDQLRSDVFRMRAQHLLEARNDCAERLAVLEEEGRQCNLPIPEQRELLLAKVKSDNGEIVQTEKKNHDMKVEKEKLKAQIQEVSADAATSVDSQSDQQKYEILFAKDQEMTTFIENYDGVKSEEEKKLVEKQQSIKMLLESISTSITMTATPEGHLKEIEGDLDFKSKQLHNAETTQNRLEAELSKRAGELEKIDSLDSKITEELHQVELKGKQYEEEMCTKFDHVAGMQQLGAEKMKELDLRRSGLDARNVSLKQQVSQLKLQLGIRKQQVADDQNHQTLDAQEQKVRQFRQTVHTLQTFIRQKTAESDYGLAMANCLDCATQLNKIHIERRALPT